MTDTPTVQERLRQRAEDTATLKAQDEPNYPECRCQRCRWYQTDIDLMREAASQLDVPQRERDDDHLTLRRWFWLNHGCNAALLYGDDGEMQCCNGHPGLDFKRESLIAVLTSAMRASQAKQTAELTELRLILKTRDEELTALKVLTVQQGEEIQRLTKLLNGNGYAAVVENERANALQTKLDASALLVTTLQEALKAISEMSCADNCCEQFYKCVCAGEMSKIADDALASVPPQEPQA